MPLNSIWEGAGNIMALDLLRALKKRGGAADAEVIGALEAEFAGVKGADARLDRFAARLFERLREAADGDADEAQARRLAADVALALQASLLRRHAPAAVADAFAAARLDAHAADVFGCLPSGLDLGAIVARAMPTTEFAA
jgi:putative acyl-CoA dehydrogenase